jgi:EmrB/QacA subfamily drug resistance transporter
MSFITQSLSSSTDNSAAAVERRRWLGLAVVCMAQLMIVLDVSIVNVALPSIQRDLHIAQSDLTWIVNAFLITFGSFLLLAGRLGDLAGRKRVFMFGITIFTFASLLCGIAPSAGLLIGARFLQGFGAALQASVILAIIVTEFPEPADRAKAMSAYVFTAVAGGSIGLLLGGVLTQALSWHWIFFVNLPIGLITILFARVLLPSDSGSGLTGGIDWLGSVLITGSVATAVYGIVQVTAHGWGSSAVLAPLALAGVLLAAFIALEARIKNPIMPLRVFAVPGLAGSSVVRGFIMTGMYSTFFLGTLYLEHVRHFGALDTGLAFLPWTLTVAILSRGITAWMVRTFGALRVLLFGMLTVIVGLTLLHSAGPDTSFFPTVFFGFLLMGLGIGSSFLPLLTIAMENVPPADAGLASGISNVAQQVSGALGLAVLGTIASSHTKSLLAEHVKTVPALVGGFHVAFLFAIGSVAIGVVVAVAVLGRVRAGVEEVEPLLASIEEEEVVAVAA